MLGGGLQVAALEQELVSARAEHSRAVARAEKQLADERSRLQRLVQQRADELDSQSTAQHEELLAAVQKAEGLKKSVAETEAAMLRQVGLCC